MSEQELEDSIGVPQDIMEEMNKAEGPKQTSSQILAGAGGSGPILSPKPDLSLDLDQDDLPATEKWSDKILKVAASLAGKVTGTVRALVDKLPKFSKLFKRKEKVAKKKDNRRKQKARPTQQDTILDISEETDIRRINGIISRLTSSERGLENRLAMLERLPEIQEPLRTRLEDNRKSLRMEGMSLDILQSTAAIFIGQGTFTRDEMIDIMKETAVREGIDPDTVEMLPPDKGYVGGLREEVEKQLEWLLPRDIEERKGAWILADAFSDEDLNKIEAKAQENQVKEDRNKEGIRAQLESTREEKTKAEARLAEVKAGGASSSAPSLKDERKALISRLHVDTSYEESDIAEQIGREVSKALDEKGKGKDDDQEQL